MTLLVISGSISVPLPSGFAWWPLMASTVESIIDPVPPFVGLRGPYLFSINGKVFITLGGYHHDGYTNAVAVEIDKRILSPRSYKRLAAKAANVPLPTSSPTSNFNMATGPFYMNGRLIGTFGKKYLIIRLGSPLSNSGVVVIPMTYSPDYFNLPMAYAPSKGYMQTNVSGINPNQQIIGYIADTYTMFQEIKVPANARFIDISYYSYSNIGIILTDEEQSE